MIPVAVLEVIGHQHLHHLVGEFVFVVAKHLVALGIGKNHTAGMVQDQDAFINMVKDSFKPAFNPDVCAHGLAEYIE